MPPFIALANSLPFVPNRLITSSVVFTLALWTSAGASYGSSSAAITHQRLRSHLPWSAETIASPSPGSIQPTPLAEVPFPEEITIAQVPSGTVPSPGMPVPWNMSQVPPGLPYGSPPTGAGEIPGQVMAQGQWTMVWMPYTMPMVGAPGQPAQSVTAYFPVWAYIGSPLTPGQMAQPPVMPPHAGLPPDTFPTTTPPSGYRQGGAPNAYDMGYPMLTMGIPGMPVGSIPYGPNIYGPPFAGHLTLGEASMAESAVSPYGQGAPPVGQYPLTVPTLPNTANNGPQAVPLPPASFTQITPTISSQPPAPTAPLNSGLTERPPLSPAIIPNPSLGTSAVAFETLPFPNGAITAPNDPITEPNLDLQGLYVLQGDRSSARARLSGEAFLTPNLMVGGALDLVTGPDLTDDDGVDLTELYLATSVPGAPGLRFRLGQLDLTSYFDRNSFAKDIGRDFFNSTFHTNPALIAGANATASRPGGLVQWTVTDDIALNAAVFSSSSDITNFALDGFAGEVGFRTGNLILRGTFLTARDSQFQGSGGRLDAYGVNAEWFIPEVNIGLFGRYGHLNNSGTGFSGDTYSFGLNALDVFMENDRLGLGYGRNLETFTVESKTPDVLELFYDFEITPNIRLGFTFQQRDQLQESYAGFRVRGDLDLLPRGSRD